MVGMVIVAMVTMIGGVSRVAVMRAQGKTPIR
jgi:hypothetical protein